MCSSEYCRPNLGMEWAELLSFSIRGLSREWRHVKPKVNQLQGTETDGDSHLPLHAQDSVGLNQRNQELDELWGHEGGREKHVNESQGGQAIITTEQTVITEQLQSTSIHAVSR